MRTTVRGDSIALCGNIRRGLPGLDPGCKLATYLLSGSYCSHSHFFVRPAILMISRATGGLSRLHLRMHVKLNLISHEGAPECHDANAAEKLLRLAARRTAAFATICHADPALRLVQVPPAEKSRCRHESLIQSGS